MIQPHATPKQHALDYAALRSAAFACFFFSGATGLLYEVVWTRMLVLVFGATTFAISTVLTAFMAGLALGGWAAGRWADRLRRPVMVYGALELLIGVYALLVPSLFSALTPFYQTIWREFHPQFYLFSIIRFAAVAAVLVVPTFLMGATLPVLGRFCTRTRHLIGADVGTLYATNTAGAVLGAFATGFILIPTAGVKSTILIAAVTNIIVGLVAVSMGRHAEAAEEEQDESPATKSETEARWTSRVVLAAFALSGFAAMGYEVAWSRTLSLINGSSVYAFTTMLTTFLLGLSLGAFLGANLPNSATRNTPLAIAIVQVGVAGSAFGALWAFGELPYWYTILFKGFGQYGHWRLTLLEFLMAGAIMLLPTVLLGMMFPLAVRVCAPTVRRLGRSVGAVYAINTIGAIAGSFCAGWVLIPWLGIQHTILACATLSAGVGLLVLAFSRGAAALRVPIGLVALGIAAACWLRAPRWDGLVMSSGMYKYAEDIADGPISKQTFLDYARGDYRLLYYKEGLTTTVTVAKHKEKGNIWMATNGKIDASSGPDMPTQILSAHLPLLLTRNPKDVLVVGFASGVTVGAAATYPIQKLVAVEIEKAVIEGSQYLNRVNHNPLADPRTQLVIDDARNYLLVADQKFDVIISEPSNPWISGASNLFTQEFFRIAKSRLRKGGVYGQWLQLYGMATEDVQSLLATLGSVYKNILVFETIEDTDLILIASDRDLKIDVARLRQGMQREEVSKDLQRIEVDDAPRLLSYFLMGSDAVRKFAAQARINTDDNGLIEFSSPRHLHDDTQTRNAEAIAKVAGAVLPYLANAGDTADARALLLAQIGLACRERELPERAEKLAALAERMSPSADVQSLVRTIRADGNDIHDFEEQ